MNKTIQELFELVNNQKYDEAIIHLNQFIKEDKKNWNAWHLLGQAYRYKGDLDNAIICHKNAYFLNKETPSILLALGIAHQINKNYIGSLNALKKAIKLDEYYTIAYNSLALTYKRMGDLDKSLDAFETGINTIAQKFFLTLTNSKQNRIYKHQDIGGMWVKSAIQGVVYLGLKLGYKTVLFPTGEQAINEEKTEKHKGLYWIETITKDGNKSFQILPNLLNTFREYLKGNKLFISMLRDQGLIFEMMDKEDDAFSNYHEAEYFEN